MTAKAQGREGVAMLLRVCGGQSGSEHRSASWLRVWIARVVMALALLGAAQAMGQPAVKFTHLTAEQAQTLLALARDYHPREGVAESHYTSCIAPYDMQAGNAQDRHSMDEALVLVEGAVRRMGYPSYAAITDDYERMRLAKMLAEKQWMKQFRADVGQCLDRAAQPR
jgi:hypothetical protein